jgi:hypothetical protein
MSQMSQPAMPAGIAAQLAPAVPYGDDDLAALGCECADPSLQIERWGDADPASAEPH